MYDYESNDLEGASFLARAEEHYLDMTYENMQYQYDHDYEDDPHYRALYMPDEGDRLLEILERIFFIGTQLPVMPHSLIHSEDIPF